jgi:hypothetical protein
MDDSWFTNGLVKVVAVLKFTLIPEKRYFVPETGSFVPCLLSGRPKSGEFGMCGIIFDLLVAADKSSLITDWEERPERLFFRYVITGRSNEAVSKVRKPEEHKEHNGFTI